MRLNQVPEVLGRAIDVKGYERIIGESFNSDITYNRNGVPIDVSAFAVTHIVKAFTADGETVQSLSNFVEMPSQPGELAQVSAAVVNGPGGHIRVRMPKTLFADNQPPVNAVRELPVLAVWVSVDGSSGGLGTRSYRYLGLYRNGGG